MTEIMTPELADYRARCFVNGVHRHSVSGNMEPKGGEFHERFLLHPWVRESVTEGWGLDLRQHLIHVVKIKLMRGETIGPIESLMPDRKWVANCKHNADRYRKAAEWRDAKGPPAIDAKGLLRRFGIEPPGSAA